VSGGSRKKKSEQAAPRKGGMGAALKNSTEQRQSVKKTGRKKKGQMLDGWKQEKNTRGAKNQVFFRAQSEVGTGEQLHP